MSCPVNNLAFVIPSEAKESLCEIAASLKFLAMTMYRSVRDMTLDIVGHREATRHLCDIF